MKNFPFEIAKALSDKQRLHLLQLIIEQSKISNMEFDSPAYRGNCAKNLYEHFDISQSTLSHHLKVLEDCGLIIRKRQGKWEHFFPELTKLGALQTKIDELIKSQNEQTTLIQTFALSQKFNGNLFKELVSLIENHGFQLVHLTSRQFALVAYMQLKNMNSGVNIGVSSITGNKTGQTFILIFNPQTSLITLNEQSDGVANSKVQKLLIDLIERYIPTLAS